MLFQAILIVIVLVCPYLLTRMTYRMGTSDWLSPVVMCYILGIGICNFSPWEIPEPVPVHFSRITILLGIPLLLFSTDLIGWFRFARTTIVSFILVIVSVLISVCIMAFVLKEHLPDTWMTAGMLAGVYIGGTPNMNAVGIALGAESSDFVKLNAAEIFCGGVYLLFLTSIAYRFFGFFLKDYEGEKIAAFDPEASKTSWNWRDVLLSILFAVLLAGLSAGLVRLVTGSLEDSGFIILLLSFFSVVASLFPGVRKLQGSFEAGEYLLLMFCVAIGMMAKFSDLLESGGKLVLFAAATLLIAVFFHLLLCRLFGIDRDTMMITQTAGFYGPPFIGQIAAVIQNRNIVFSGIATGLVGLAVANFLGVAIGRLLKIWLGMG